MNMRIEAYANLDVAVYGMFCFMFKHWFCWKNQYNISRICLILSTIYIFIPVTVSGCVGRGPSALLCPGPIMLLRRPWSEWLLFNANSAMFQLYRGENKLIFNEMTWSSLCTRQTLLDGFLLCSLDGHWNNSPRINMSSHSDTLSRAWFRAKQYSIGARTNDPSHSRRAR